MDAREFLSHFKAVREAGPNEWFSLCPCHDDKNGSLHFTQKNGELLLHCFAGCDATDIIHAVGLRWQDLPGKERQEPYRRTASGIQQEEEYPPIAEEYALEDAEDTTMDAELAPAEEPAQALPSATAAPSAKKAYRRYGCTLEEYAEDKKFPVEKLKEFHLENRQRISKSGKASPGLFMPYLGGNGEPLKLRWRMLLHKDPQEKYSRFVWEKDDRPLPLYGLWKQPKDRKYAVLVEGESDCHALWCGGCEALGIPGASNYKPELHQKQLEEYSRLYVHLEKDKGGETMWNRFTGEDGRNAPSPLLTRMRFFCLPKQYKDPSDLWCKVNADENLFQDVMRTALKHSYKWTEFRKPGEWTGKGRNQKGQHQEKSDRGKAGAANGASGGRPSADYAGLARAYFQARVMRDGQATLRKWRGAWYRWNGRCYKPMNDADYRADAALFLQTPGIADQFGVQASDNAVRNMDLNLSAWTMCGIPSDTPMQTWISERESADGWLAMRNCILQTEIAANSPHILQEEGRSEFTPEEEARYRRPLTADLLSTFAMDYDYDPNAQCPKFLQWLQSTLPDREVQECIQQMFGLMLVPDTTYNVCFFLEGEGGCGKTTFLDILRGLIGKENICRVPLLKFDDKFATWPLTENLVNIVGEMPTSDPQGRLRYIEGDFKDSVSGGDIHVEKKGKDATSAPCTARHVFATNSLPMFFDKSEAIWDRLIIIPFTQRFRHTTMEVRDIAETIVPEELPGIFNYALEGLAKLRERTRFPEPPLCALAKAKHRSRCDVEATYLNEFYHPSDKSEEISIERAYKHYRQYLTDNGLSNRSSPTFVDAVLRVFPEVEIGIGFGAKRVFKGLTAPAIQSINPDF